MRRFAIASLFFVGVLGHVHAEAPPCGIDIIRTEGSKVDDRYVPATPQHVKAAVLLALPALAAKVAKVKGLHIESDTDQDLYLIAERRNQDDGVHGVLRHGMGAFGHFKIDIQPETRDSIAGALLHVEFHKNAMRGRVGSDHYATPMAEETACLATILSFNDPPKNPRGVPSPGTAASQSVVVPEGTPIKVQLFEPLYSKKLKKNSAGQEIQFEVAADVQVDGVTVVQRGALAVGHFTKVDKAKGYGRHGEVDFAFDSVTARDGQMLPVTGATEKSRGGRTNDTATTALMSPALGWLFKGNEAFIRTGTSYDLEVSGQHTLEAGK